MTSVKVVLFRFFSSNNTMNGSHFILRIRIGRHEVHKKDFFLMSMSKIDFFCCAVSLPSSIHLFCCAVQYLYDSEELSWHQCSVFVFFGRVRSDTSRCYAFVMLLMATIIMSRMKKIILSMSLSGFSKSSSRFSFILSTCILYFRFVFFFL